MTIDQILQLTTAELEAMPDDKLHELLNPLLVHTRPVEVVASQSPTKRILRPQVTKEADALSKLRNTLLKFGADLPS